MLKEYNNYYLSKIGFNVTDKNLKRYIQKRDISSQKYIKLNQYIEKNISKILNEEETGFFNHLVSLPKHFLGMIEDDQINNNIQLSNREIKYYIDFFSTKQIMFSFVTLFFYKRYMFESVYTEETIVDLLDRYYANKNIEEKSLLLFPEITNYDTRRKKYQRLRKRNNLKLNEIIGSNIDNNLKKKVLFSKVFVEVNKTTSFLRELNFYMWFLNDIKEEIEERIKINQLNGIPEISELILMGLNYKITTNPDKKGIREYVNKIQFAIIFFQLNTYNLNNEEILNIIMDNFWCQVKKEHLILNDYSKKEEIERLEHLYNLDLDKLQESLDKLPKSTENIQVQYFKSYLVNEEKVYKKIIKENITLIESVGRYTTDEKVIYNFLREVFLMQGKVDFEKLIELEIKREKQHFDVPFFENKEIREQYKKEVQENINKKFDIGLSSKINGLTLALVMEDLELFKELHEKGLSIYDKDSNDSSILLNALQQGERGKEIVDYLLTQNGIHYLMDSQTKTNKRTPFLYLIINRRYQDLKKILKIKAVCNVISLKDINVIQQLLMLKDDYFLMAEDILCEALNVSYIEKPIETKEDFSKLKKELKDIVKLYIKNTDNLSKEYQQMEVYKILYMINDKEIEKMIEEGVKEKETIYYNLCELKKQKEYIRGKYREFLS